jgi:hypothetical protein
MFIEASSPQKKGDKARLVTPKYPYYEKGYCLSLYYHMFGNLNFQKSYNMT